MNKSNVDTSPLINDIGMPEEEKAKYAGPPLYENKPLVISVRNSKSMGVAKSTVNASTKRRLFGPEGVKVPEGTPSIHLLQFLDEKHLFEVNQKIVALYQKEITAENVAYFKKREQETYTNRMKSLDKLPLKGPPLKRRVGK